MFIASSHNELTENKSVLRVHSKQMMILYTTDFNLHEMEVRKAVKKFSEMWYSTEMVGHMTTLT